MTVRRALGVLVAAAAAGALAVLVLAGGRAAEAGPGKYRVDVIFDSAKGVVPGQEVKIAGARVGTIRDVSLTPDYKARIALEVDGRFAPFRRDARCSLQPEGLIAERFVQCDPGTPGAGALRPQGDEAPTVPVDRTTLPVSLTDLFRVFDTPSSQRLSLLLSALGAGVSGRGQDLNAILLRSNPTLLQVRRVLATLARQRRELQTAVTSTGRVVRALARHRGGVQRLVEHAAGAGERLAARRRSLTEAVRRLPALLREARPALRKLDGTAAALAPVLGDLRRSAAPVDRTLRELPSFAASATPALRDVGAASRRGLAAAPPLEATGKLLRTFAGVALPAGQALDRTLVSLRDSGTFEGLLLFAYNAGAVLALHDDISHIGPSLLGPSICFVDVNQGCASEKPEGKARRRAHRQRRPKRRRPAPPAAIQPAPQAAAPAPGGQQAPPLTLKLPGLPPISVPGVGAGPPPQDGGGDGSPVKRLLDSLLK